MNDNSRYVNLVERLRNVLLADEETRSIEAAIREVVICVREVIEDNDAVDSLAEGGWMHRKTVLDSLDGMLNAR